jgi:hypothetical protein
MYFQKWNCAAYLFHKQNYNDLSPNSYTHISVRDLYISIPWSVCLFCCSQICGLILGILGIYKSLTDTWMWKLGLRPRRKGIHNWDFRCSAETWESTEHFPAFALLMYNFRRHPNIFCSLSRRQSPCFRKRDFSPLFYVRKKYFFLEQVLRVSGKLNSCLSRTLKLPAQTV